MKKTAWLMLIYSLPARPSTQRVYVWRKLKAAGVLYLQHSVCLLPQTQAGQKTLAEIKKAVEERKGEAKISTIRFDSAQEESDVIRRFQSQSDEEYTEFLGKCRDFHQELKKERAQNHFTFAELEENEVELDKLNSWLPKISARDFFGAHLASKATTALKGCAVEFNSYSVEVSRRQMKNP